MLGSGMSGNIVRKRQVFYLSGFDPRGARHYHRLYQSEAGKQGAVTGTSYAVSPRRKVAPYIHRWDVKHGDCETRYDFLAWDDIIRAEWSEGVAGTLRDVWFFFRYYFLNGHIWKFGRDRPHPLIAGFYPLVLVTVTILLAAAAACGILNAWPNIFGFIAGVGAAYGIFRSGLAFGHKFAAFWLSRIYVFSVRWARGDIPAVTPRLALFASAVTQALADPEIDEVLVVGHSVGGMISVPMLRDVLTSTADIPQGKLSFLTIGACIPLASFWHAAEEYRRDLSIVAHDPRLSWVDYTAKTDGATFYLLDPVTGSGIPRQSRGRPILLSPRFFTLFHACEYKRIRFNWYKMHFLYLMAGQIAGDYDFFKLTAGPRKLNGVVS